MKYIIILSLLIFAGCDSQSTSKNSTKYHKIMKGKE